MPTFDFTSPDGKIYTIEGPDGATAEQAFNILQQHLAVQPQQSSNMLTDIAKGAGTGLAEGAIGLAGMPGDIKQLVNSGADWLLGKALGPATPEQQNAMNAAPNLMPTSSQIQNAAESVTGPFYQPQTVPGQYAKTIGQFALAALLGPGSLAKRVATQAVVPALSSETAGQLTKGSAIEPYARTAAALVSPGATEALTAKRVAMPTAEELRSAGGAAYRTPEVTSVRLDQNSVENLANSIALDPASAINAPTTDKLAGALEKLAATKPNLTIDDVKNFRTAFNTAARDARNPITGTMTSEGEKASKAAAKITDFFRSLSPSDVTAGNARAATSTLRRADADYAAGMRAQAVARLMKRAELQAGSTYSGGNVNNATRQALKSLLRNEKATAGYTPQELAQLKKAVLGTKTGNTARYIGKLLGGGGGLSQMLLGAGGLGASYYTGNPAYLALPALGLGARKLGDISTGRQAAKFSDLVRSRAPLSAAAVAQNKLLHDQMMKNLLTRGLLAGVGGHMALRPAGY